MPQTRTFRKTSISDVARLAGVSKTTVSYFISGREDICAPATAERIRAAVATLQYTPSPIARGTHNATRTIGVCLYSPLDPEVRFGNAYFEGLWRGIVETADTTDYALLHYPRSVRNGTDGSAFLDGRVDGILIHGQDNLRASLVAGAGMPVVLLSRSRRIPEGCGAVSADQAQIAERAVDWLQSLGHRRIAHLAGPIGVRPGVPKIEEGADDNAFDRYEAFTARMKRDNTFDPDLVRFADAWDDPTGQTAALAVAAWRSLPNPPTAVFCANDTLAVALCRAAREAGWRVAADVSIVGVDDSPAARACDPPMTSVPVPVMEVGSAAVHLLIQRMDSESGAVDSTDTEEHRLVRVPVHDIVVRASTGRVRDGE